MKRETPKYDTTAVRLTADDRRLVDAIRAKLGVRNGAEVFRLGLRALAREQNVDCTPPQTSRMS